MHIRPLLAVSLCSTLGASLPLTLAASPSVLETITVTATQEAARLADTAASVGVLSAETLAELNGVHAADSLNRIAGVNLAQLGSTGSGVAAAIRQPMSYGPVYLYLENNVPTRSAAFFNHNALYEVNTAQADGVEIIKGPGSALYGSEAIGGVVNLLNGQPADASFTRANLEAGEFGFKRLQIKAAQVDENDAVGGTVEWLSSDGWRDHTAYEKVTGVLSWATEVGEFEVNSVLSASHIDNESGGSGLRESDYLNEPEKAGNLIGYRDVSAVRLTSEWRTSLGAGELTLTPFARHNRLEYLATWALNTGRETCKPWLNPACQLDSQDAHINANGHDSLGVNAKYKQDTEAAFWIAGIDTDRSRGDTLQTYIVRTDTDPGDYWLSYQEQQALYDYRVDFLSLSPYLHTEAELWEGLRLSAGLRYDWVSYNYHTRLAPESALESIHKRPADTEITQSHLSPKLGATWDISPNLNAYAAYRHAFRIATESQLFRAGRTVNSTELEPVKADSVEIGIRGLMGDWLNTELSIYHMTLHDEIISTTDATGARRNTNAGTTRHRGLELALAADLTEQLQAGFAGTWARHEYVDWQEANNNYSGKQQVMAPEVFTTLWLSYRPGWLKGGRLEAEWRHQSESFIDEANTQTYPGHDLVNLRASYNISQPLTVYANLLNATDERYAETTSKWGPSYSPGRPRTLIAGLNYRF
ncbi:TonB-dependent receptor [Simiduia sp. 21SJ11W-1]|uniref:TonB-dependent receptor n=1 Tax=Simiduia sp. 21SJ11W-1 TaxID=2909669 RepID=UPI00209CFFE1|nr:TonB-dependent receptor [Simiduia sp. 21SJ11W-1]UTA49024.1 TonB-dependent receptor [Simiduia sp. 21SJ11W-1]